MPALPTPDQKQFYFHCFAQFSLVKCKTLPNVKTYFVRINLGLSEAAAQGPDVGARRARKMARPEPA